VRRSIASTLLAVVALAAASCSGSGSSVPTSTPAPRPSSPAELSIVAPTDGEVVHGSSVELRVSLRHAKIVQPTTTHIVPDEGHLHVILDDHLVSMTEGLRQKLSGLTAGTHVLQVEFVASDHAPFDPRVIAAVTFRVVPT
jgi:hypothetical protein